MGGGFEFAMFESYRVPRVLLGVYVGFVRIIIIIIIRLYN